MGYIATKKLFSLGKQYYPGDMLSEECNCANLVKRGWAAFVADGKTGQAKGVQMSDLSPAAVKVAAKSWKPGTVHQLLAEEIGGKNRKSVIDILHDRLTELAPKPAKKPTKKAAPKAAPKPAPKVEAKPESDKDKDGAKGDPLVDGKTDEKSEGDKSN